MKKILATLLAALMIISLLPVTTFAATSTATITFNDKAKRTEYDTSHQVWEENGIVVTNNKAASTSNVGDYSNPARFYKSSTLIVEYPGMTKIEIKGDTSSSNKYFSGWSTSKYSSGTLSISGQYVTITFAEPTDSITISSLGSQLRAYSITVSYELTTSCTHANAAEQSDGYAAICGVSGKTNSWVCPDCGAITVEQNEIPALEHNLVDGLCTVCGVPTPDSTLTIAEATALGQKFAHSTYTVDKYYVTGVITQVYNTQYGNMYISDDNGETTFTIYGTYGADGKTGYSKMDPMPVAGDTVTIYGNIGQYNGTSQIKDGWITEHIPSGEEIETGLPEEENAVVTIEQAIFAANALGGSYTELKYTVTGKITEVYNAQYGNMYIADEAGNKLTIYGSYNADGSIGYADMDSKPVAGDTVTVLGVIGSYNGDPQMKNVWIQSFEHEHAWGEAVDYIETCTTCGATRDVTPAFVITAQPEDTSVTAGEKATFTVAAEGVGVTYCWRYSRDGINWYDTAMEGAETATLTVPALVSRNGYKYYCVLTDETGAELVSEIATLTVAAAELTVADPESVTVTDGDTAQFTVGHVDGYNYSWQYSRDGGTTWYETAMTGYNTATLSVPAPLARNGYQYRCVVSDGNGSEKVSAVATLTVEKQVTTITTQPAAATAENGTAVFSVVVEGKVIEYRWQYSRDGGTTWYETAMTGYNTDTLTVAAIPARDGYCYKVQIIDQYGQVIFSDMAELTVN